jgi:hypothetical protein
MTKTLRWALPWLLLVGLAGGYVLCALLMAKGGM